jgi:iron complex outermembrane receptor protein
LKPEKSKQWTLGFRIEPVRGLSLGADLWSVNIKGQIQSSGIPQAEAFANPQKYLGLFLQNYADPQGFNTIALEQLPINGGYSNNKGLDWDTSYRTTMSFGKLTTSWTGTWMIKQDYTLFDGDAVHSDLAKFGVDQNVVFRTQMRLSASLQTGPLTNTINANYKSGYKDQVFAAGTGIYPVNADGTLPAATVAFPGLDVPSNTTFDWQAKYEFSKSLSFTGGIHNMFDRKPPLSLQAQVSGNSAGYDPRYADVIGRAFYVRGAYSF